MPGPGPHYRDELVNELPPEACQQQEAMQERMDALIGRCITAKDEREAKIHAPCREEIAALKARLAKLQADIQALEKTGVLIPTKKDR